VTGSTPGVAVPLACPDREDDGCRHAADDEQRRDRDEQKRDVHSYSTEIHRLSFCWFDTRQSPPGILSVGSAMQTSPVAVAPSW